MRPYIKWILLFLIFALFLGSLAGLSVGLMHDLPQITDLERYRPPAITRIYSKDHVLLAEFFSERRKIVPSDAIPEILKKALIATEDRNFFHHSGIDPKGILRAIIRDIRAMAFVEGASTLTQQLAKTLFLSPDKKLIRKAKEAVLALQIERRYTKDEILTLYLNQIYLGSGTYGVESASRSYFGKSVSDLTLAEAALIAGLPKAPSRYSPLVSPNRAKKRRDIVLSQMKKTGVITTDQYHAAIKTPVRVTKNPPVGIRAPWFLDQVRMELEQAIGPDLLYQSGLTVTTTLDWKLQKAAETAVTRHLAELTIRMRKNGIDGIPQAACVAIENETGAILAMVGGSAYDKSPFNRASQAKRQPGSAFKSLIFALAIQKGSEQNQTISDTPVAYPAANGTTWAPQNFSRSFLGDITFRKALAKSKNIPAIRLTESIGPAAITAFARTLGIATPLRPNLSLGLGTSEVSLEELTGAYTTFPSGGIQSKRWRILSVTDPEGRLLYSSPRAHHAVMDPRSAAIMTDMLAAVVQEGTGRRGQMPQRPLGGKTGTTDAYRDALFIGFSPAISLGVWTGCDDNTSLGPYETGAKAALPIWSDIMRSVPKSDIPEYFPIPDGVFRKRMDPVTGHILLPDEPGGVAALFRIL